MISEEQDAQNEAGAIKKELKEQQAWNTRTKQFFFPNSQRPKVHKHHFNPHTITGKIMDRTFETLSEPDGEHICEICGAMYNKKASLQSHRSRVHNPNLTVQCPKCPKMLSAKHALRKHLLSHKPENEWPYRCEFCYKHFQAKGDLPKHFATKKHRNDPNVPNPGTEEFKEVLERSCMNIKIKMEKPKKEKKKSKKKKKTKIKSEAIENIDDIIDEFK